MYRNILIPVDLSERSARAIDAAASLADSGGASITLLHVIEAIQDVEDEEVRGFYEKIREKAKDTLGRWASSLSAKGHKVDIQIIFGKRGAEILRYADQQDIDLMILTTHAIDREKLEEGFGTLSHQLALFADCAVLLVR